MYSSTVPNSQILIRQLISESGITSRQQQLNLKRQFKRKFSHHINLMQYHQLRQDRFINSQKKILQKQNNSIQKAKEFLYLRIEKANNLKNETLRGRTKQMEDGLSKWQKIIKKNRQQEQNRIRHAEKLVKNWNDKLSSSSSRKSMRLIELSKNIKEKTQEKEQKVQSFRNQLHAQMMRNPQEYKKQQMEQRERYLQSTNKSDSRRISRVSTESIYDKKKRQQENQLEKSLIKIVNKEQRINEARQIKFYLQEKKKKQRSQKQEAIRKLRQNNLNSLRNLLEQKNQILDEKYNNSRVKVRNKPSLPQINGNKAVNIAINGPGEQWRKKDILTPSVSPYSPYRGKNYDRLITEKLKDVSMMMRRNRNI